MKYEKRLEAIREIAVRNELPFHSVMGIYTQASCKVYIKYKGREKYGNPELEEKIFRMTERYFDIKKQKDLKAKISKTNF